MSTNVCKIRKGQSHFKQKFNEFSYNDNLQYGTCHCPLTKTLVDLGKRTVSQAENRFCCKIDPYDGIKKNAVEKLIGKETQPKITFILICINQVRQTNCLMIDSRLMFWKRCETLIFNFSSIMSWGGCKSCENTEKILTSWLSLSANEQRFYLYVRAVQFVSIR